MSSIQSYPARFWYLCLACLLFFSSFTMVLPDMPVYLAEMGGKAYTWAIIPVFAFIAMISRPFSGKFSDSAGRVFVMVLGAIITTMASLFYLLFPVLILFFVIRAFHGLCAGFTPTGFTAYADDIVPLSKRGEAMGIVGICNNIGNAIGWVIGSKCTNLWGIEAMFITASALGFLSLLIFAGLKESIHNKQRFNTQMLKISKHDLIEKQVLVPGIILLLTAFSSGAILALISDFTGHIGIKNKGMYMGIYIISSIITRYLAGRWSDRYGRKVVALYGAFFLSMSMLMLSFTTEIVLYSFSSVFFGIGFGLISPALFAWAADLALPGYKGKAMGTLFIFMELGIIVGSAFTGLLYNNNPDNFAAAFFISALLAFSPILILRINSDKFKKLKPQLP